MTKWILFFNIVPLRRPHTYFNGIAVFGPHWWKKIIISIYHIIIGRFFSLLAFQLPTTRKLLYTSEQINESFFVCVDVYLVIVWVDVYFSHCVVYAGLRSGRGLTLYAADGCGNRVFNGAKVAFNFLLCHRGQMKELYFRWQHFRRKNVRPICCSHSNCPYSPTIAIPGTTPIMSPPTRTSPPPPRQRLLFSLFSFTKTFLSTLIQVLSQ